MKGWATALTLSACELTTACSADTESASKTREVRIAFEALVNGRPLACDASYEPVGKTKSSITLRDLKLFIHNPVLVRASEERVDVELEQDGAFQRDRLALIDLEDATGECDTGSPLMHAQLVGQVPDHADYVALDFEVGVPESDNHGDAATAPAPLAEPGMWWGYRDGYKHMRLDVQTSFGQTYGLHLGAVGCERATHLIDDTDATDDSYTCRERNAVQVHLQADDPLARKVILDVGKLLRDVDLASGVVADESGSAGCFAARGSADCKTVFGKLGLPWDGDIADELQSVFSLVKR